MRTTLCLHTALTFKRGSFIQSSPLKPSEILLVKLLWSERQTKLEKKEKWEDMHAHAHEDFLTWPELHIWIFLFETELNSSIWEKKKKNSAVFLLCDADVHAAQRWPGGWMCLLHDRLLLRFAVYWAKLRIGAGCMFTQHLSGIDAASNGKWCTDTWTRACVCFSSHTIQWSDCNLH